MNVPRVNMVAIWIAVVIGLTSPVALGFARHIYETKLKKEEPQGRTRVTFATMILASTGLLLLPIFFVVHAMQIGSKASTERVIPVQLGFALGGVGVKIWHSGCASLAVPKRCSRSRTLASEFRCCGCFHLFTEGMFGRA